VIRVVRVVDDRALIPFIVVGQVILWTTLLIIGLVMLE